MGIVSLRNQNYEVPNSKKPGQSATYRNGNSPVLNAKFSPNVNNIYDIFAHGLTVSRDRNCLGTRKTDLKTGIAGPYEWQTYRQVSHRIDNFGSGLMNTINHTLKDTRTKGIPIAIWSTNRPEWTITDMACAAYGLTIVALYDTLGPDTVEFVINHSNIETVVCSGDHVADILKQRHLLPSLKLVISMDTLEENTPQLPGCTSKGAVLRAWAEEKNILLLDYHSVEAAGKQNRRSHNLPQPDDLACIMYTSGTTGLPKGAMLTHRNFVAALSSSITDLDAVKDDVYISYLPLAHIYGRVTDITALGVGACIGYFRGSIDTLIDDIQELKPTVFASVPRLLNRIYGKVVMGTIEAPGITGVIARKAVADKMANLVQGKGYTHAVWDRLLFNKVKMALGGNVRTIISGSAPLGKDVMQFLRVALACSMHEGYGATETCAMTCTHFSGENKAGHIGAPFSCNEVKLVDVPEMNYLTEGPVPSGELCVRGDNVFVGYYKEEEKTREVLDSEGWYHTGDIATLNKDGRLQIIDRKKNIFKLAQGEYIAPEKIENVYCKSSVVAQLFIYGDSLQASLVMIVVPEPEAFNAFVAAQLPAVAAQKLSFEALCKNAQVKEAMLRHLIQVGQKAKLQGFEQAKAIYLHSEPFTMAQDLLTPTLKVKRPQAAKYFKDSIDAMYEELTSRTQKPTAKL
ncbi:hypothetical protein BDF14DRAFT_1792338 [Spinellus fusiger]|nr:hypothetical protein BDF14DRAFT_1792338 [Spinellus fusiger]